MRTNYWKDNINFEIYYLFESPCEEYVHLHFSVHCIFDLCCNGTLVLLQTDIGGLVAQIKDLEKKNAELEERNQILTSKVKEPAC